MKLDSMFNRKTTDLVRVPEIEVYDDRVEVHRSDPEQERQSSPERDPETRSYRLPKTTWFAENGGDAMGVTPRLWGKRGKGLC